MANRTAIRKHLYDTAMAAFAAAREASQLKTEPGTPEWEHWKEMCDIAVRANDAYRRELAEHPIENPNR
jgi:hypothetical protein